MDTMLHDILDTLQPSSSATQVAKEVLDVLQNLSDAIAFAVGGSLAKNTHLKGNHDCDIFARFDQSEQDEDLSNLLEAVLRETPFDIQRVHGSRDYFQFTYKQVDFEIVPVYNIQKASEAKNVTDCSYLHILWTNSFTKKKVNGLALNDHIRLAKQFCKAQRVYGAESYIGGISGHVVDILVIHYGGFQKFISHVAQWDTSSKIIVDPTQAYDSEKAALASLNEAKTLAPLVVIDPVDNLRNAASALTKRQLIKLVGACASYLKKPAKTYFKAKKITLHNVISQPSFRCEIHLGGKQGKKDIVGAKLVKASQHLEKEAKAHGFTVVDTTFLWEDEYATIFLSFAAQKIPKTYEHQGPPIAHERAKEFTSKHPETYIKEGRFYAKRTRNYTNAKSLVKDLLQSDYVQQRTTSTQLIDTYNA